MNLTVSAQAAPVARRKAHPLVNDVHSRLNATTIKDLFRPESLVQLAGLVKAAATFKQPLSIAASRHAMGGQQFLQNGVLIDMSALDRVIEFDPKAGTITLEAGIDWPKLLQELERLQPEHFRWTFLQKQTGADHLSIGGALSANIHGRGLQFRPFVQDIVSFDIINPEGRLMRCSRSENAELFSLAIGGYGLFGVIYAVTLRLTERHKLQRSVGIIEADELISAFQRRIQEGFTYGDFQFSIDDRSEDFLNRGVFSCYKPVPLDTEIPAGQRKLSSELWEHLLYLAHADKPRVWQEYSGYYLSTDQQVYWSDLHQLSHYPEGYHHGIDQKLQHHCPHTEMITEIYVPRHALGEFLRQVRKAGRKQGWNVVYGTIRLIERDTETFLPWAREPWVCLIFNLCVEHSVHGLARARHAFRTLIDAALDHAGSYYLTYHKWATQEQLHRCHPQAGEFFQRKQKYDPQGLFTSNWHRHYTAGRE